MAIRQVITGGDRRDIDTTAIKKYRDKPIPYGTWRGPREGKLFELFEQATIIPETVPAARDAFAEDKYLTPEGQLHMMREGNKGFFARRAAARRDAETKRKRLTQERDELLQFEWDANTGVHDRLIARWNAMSEKDQQQFLLTGQAKQHPELAKALLKEPALTSGVRADQRDMLRNALLTDEQQAKLAALEADAADLTTLERAWDTSAEIIRKECEYDDDEYQTLLATKPAQERKPVEVQSKRKVEGLGALLEKVGDATDDD
jgi:hypothetical protein